MNNNRLNAQAIDVTEIRKELKGNMKDRILNRMMMTWSFINWLIWLIGLLAIVAFIKLQITGSVEINPDIFRSTREVQEIETRLKDLETYEVNNLPEKLERIK